MSEALQALLTEPLPGGAHWSMVIKRGRLLRITDIEGGANVALAAFNAHERLERLNLPDTLKCQHTAKLTQGHCLYSDMGRVLLCISGDTVGWHDSIGGLTDADDVRARYGVGRYQELRNGYYKNGVDSMLVEMGKWGMTLRDLPPVLNLFSRVRANADGEFALEPGNSPAGSHVDLYAPMDTLVVLSTIQHPLDTATTYAPKPVELSLYKVDDEAAITRECRHSRPENERGFTLTERLYL